MHHAKMCEIVEYRYKNAIKHFLKETCEIYNDDKITDKIISAVAYAKVGQEGFSGRERKIYTELKEELRNSSVLVQRVQFVKTGIYNAPSGGYDNYWGEYDYEPGYLDKEKTHKILHCFSYGSYGNFMIEATNVRKEINEEI